MAIDKTKLHCPRCGCEYEIDPGIYSNRESIECVCGRKWRANPELEELCTKKLKPYSRVNTTVSVIFYFLMPSIVALLFWIKYHYQTKKLRSKQYCVQYCVHSKVQKKFDSTEVVRNMDVLRWNLDESVRRLNIVSAIFLIKLILGVLFNFVAIMASC